MQGCLGRVESRRDRRTLRMAAYLDGTRLPASPPARDWSREVKRFDMHANDRIGDCTCVAAAHLMTTWAANHGVALGIPTADVIAAYRSVSGYNPSDPTSDIGAQMIDVLRHWKKAGIAGQQILAYAQLDIANRQHIEAGVNLFGGVYVGADLPRASSNQTLWDVAPAGVWDRAYDRGSRGGHAMALVGYSRTAVMLATWGGIKLATWEWLATYVSEAWVVLDELWADVGKVAPSGFDFERLKLDLAAL